MYSVGLFAAFTEQFFALRGFSGQLLSRIIFSHACAVRNNSTYGEESRLENGKRTACQFYNFWYLFTILHVKYKPISVRVYGARFLDQTFLSVFQ